MKWNCIASKGLIPLRIHVEKDYESLSELAASVVAYDIVQNPNIVLGMATGGTPIGMYKVWVNQVREGNLSFREATTFNLDEYLGLDATHPKSFRFFMQENLFKHIDININRTFFPIDDMNQPFFEYDSLIQQESGIDVQILGIGRNGHIGFNEPGEDFNRLTHVVELTESTRQANARFFSNSEEVPTHAITMGLASIMNAKKVVLLASGVDKSLAIYNSISGEVSPKYPASILQQHPNCTVILDEDAASLLPK